MNRSLRLLSLRLKRMWIAGFALRWFRAIRAWFNQFIDLPIRQLRTAVRRFERGPVDVVYLGNSTNLFVAPDEPRWRRLHELIKAEFPDARTVDFLGPAYNLELYSEFIRLLSTLERRPRLVVASLALRTAATNIVEHPDYGYHHAIKLMRDLKKPTGHLPFFSARNRRTATDWQRFEALPLRTRWSRGQTIGDFLSVLRGRRNASEDLERQRALFDYLHGEFLTPDHPPFHLYAELGGRLREYGVPVVAYWAPVPVDRGETYFPGQFAQHIDTNMDVARKSFEDALGPLCYPVELGHTPDEEFIDSRDGSEHWNFTGRRRVVRLIAEQMRHAIARPRRITTGSER